MVVGGGHAGIEAAWAAAKFGPTALLIGNPATIGRMPCNPAVGGPGKSQLVFEVQAMGGLMGRIADDTAIHTRVLNASKGPAVQSLRVQNERDAYAVRAQEYVLGHSGIDILRAEAAALERDHELWHVVTTDGRRYRTRCVVLATGTFLQGVTWYGRTSRPEGRQGEPPSRFLSSTLSASGHRLKRFKTGTPPRVRADSVNFDVLQEIAADPHPRSFSGRSGPQAASTPTWQTHTTPTTHRLIQENLHESPMYAGDIAGLGPRYCPSIEDKVVRFAHHDRHLLFVEPDGVNTSEVYLQGFSSSLPPHLQDTLVRSLPGFERAVIQRYAYAVEYDVIDTTELTLNLESRYLPGVFTAGQVNGTSGYEEAAAQGLVAGSAAGRRASGLTDCFVSRETGYIGVMLDDLVFKGSDEPYRMMTSRVEHRLLCRQDNADERLAPLAHDLGLIDHAALAKVRDKYERIRGARQQLEQVRWQGNNALGLLRRPEYTLSTLRTAGVVLPELDSVESESLEINVKYEGYIARARRQLQAEEHSAEMRLDQLDYSSVAALSTEAREKLAKVRPSTVAQATRVPGVRRGDVTALLVHLRQVAGVSRETKL
ncbi:glucose-inhibited division protein A [Deinococcus peraridilitoris DSM 19664]|uniref:tRNA uridine 5-carboxymethylaminomethyl modification enzyme MnmG n=2 Tax=Deinococcus TaxID=1298 RepID=L0A0R9_DEIPD|nr:glucose-inhibited division protein A [Deinococcus peraridilitoris DSM 19664]